MNYGYGESSTKNKKTESVQNMVGARICNGKRHFSTGVIIYSQNHHFRNSYDSSKKAFPSRSTIPYKAVILGIVMNLAQYAPLL